MQIRRFVNLTDTRLIALLFGDAAKPYEFHLGPNERDEHGNEGPGDECGVDVPEELARKWDAGIQACWVANVNTHSLEGLTIRYEAMHGTRELPPAFVERFTSEQREATRKLEKLLCEVEKEVGLTPIEEHHG